MEEQKINSGRDVEELISNLCNIILTEEDDEPDFGKAVEYIEKLTAEEKRVLRNGAGEYRYKIRTIVLNNVLQYIKKYNTLEGHNASYPFSFDSTGGFARYCQKFENEYKKNNSERPSRFPILLRWTFEYIQEISNQYRLFGVLYDIRVKETTNKLANQMEELVDKKTNDSIDVLKREAENAVKSASGEMIEPDGIHLNRAGQLVLADLWIKTITGREKR